MLCARASKLLHLNIWIVTPWQTLKKPAAFLEHRVRAHRVAVAAANRSMSANARIHTWITVAWSCLAHVAHTCWSIVKAWHCNIEVWSLASWVVLARALIVHLHYHFATSGSSEEKAFSTASTILPDRITRRCCCKDCCTRWMTDGSRCCMMRHAFG